MNFNQKVGENQCFKLAQQGRSSKLGMIKPTLVNPDVIIEEYRPDVDGNSERDTSYIFIRTFVKSDGSRYYYFSSVTVLKDGKEVVISNQEKSYNKISRLLQNGNIVLIKDFNSLHPKAQIEESIPLNDSNELTNDNNQSTLLGINSSVDDSYHKGSNNQADNKELGENNLSEAIDTAEAQTDNAGDNAFKAPNGEPSNLTRKQWAQVRTQAFKEWFGDWEKSARIEKLRASEPIVISGEEYQGKYELNRDSAKSWLKENIRGAYINNDTNERIEASKVGIDKVTSHGEREDVHLKSLSAIPQLIENSIFIEERANAKGNSKYDTYQYYVAGLNIDGVDYTAKVVIGVKGDAKYYDHNLTEIEKGALIDNLNVIAKHVADNQSSHNLSSTGLSSMLDSEVSNQNHPTNREEALNTSASKGFTTTGNASVPSYTENKDKRLI